MRTVVIFGAPGSGKGTQATFISERFGLEHISTGDLFRRHLKEQTSLGREVQSYLDRGALVPDQITLDMLKDHFDQTDLGKGFLLDGFPRTIVQANDLEKMLALRSDNVVAVIALEVPREALVSRLLLRGEGSGRSDDSDPQIIKNRIDTYLEVTHPVKDFYRAKGKIETLRGVGSVDDIAQNIAEILERLLPVI